MKTLVLLFALYHPHHYVVCIQSPVGVGCSNHKWDKKTALTIRDMFAQAPINAEYGTWIQDTRKPSGPPVVGPHDQTPTKEPSNNGSNI